MDRIRGDADNWLSGDLSQYKTGQEIFPQKGTIRRMDRMRGNADNWISEDLSQYKTGQQISSQRRRIRRMDNNWT